jgi:16S rRNA (cytidine1402-2'-O)-methyltransferase
VRECLDDLAQAFGAERAAVVAREITKKFETVYRGTLADLAAQAARDPDFSRGEIVIVVRGCEPRDESDEGAAAAEALLRALLEDLPVSQAAKIAARITGRGRSELYERALTLTKPTRE